MDEAQYRKWHLLRTEFDLAVKEFQLAHEAMMTAVEKAHTGGLPGVGMTEHFISHDRAAENWINARANLVEFCRNHPAICASAETVESRMPS